MADVEHDLTRDRRLSYNDVLYYNPTTGLYEWCDDLAYALLVGLIIAIPGSLFAWESVYPQGLWIADNGLAVESGITDRILIFPTAPVSETDDPTILSVREF